ncbi:MAG: hypothetical protein LCI00_10675 [Chloroflexi bacterium]|nr:hypothetical protein [Chloroflexota bacterium]MCC6892097.1 hypothetical protein [Anaerolineae bacterium]
MDTPQIITSATVHLEKLPGHIFDVLSVAKPVSPAAGVNLAKVISKLSPLLGNLIEFNIVEILNEDKEFGAFGSWIRQDPGFPDAIFQGTVDPIPGFEVKAWFPLSTEITARFKDSQNHFVNKNIYMALLAWLPEHVIYGRPRILDVAVIEGGSIAYVRDTHYHNPPDYLVLEPEDTRSRTRNLQQTNTNGYKWQGTQEKLLDAQKVVESWGAEGRVYKPTIEYQTLLRQLLNRYSYRLDTNFAKIDRIGHPDIELFKRRVQDTIVEGMTVRQWSRISGGNDQIIQQAFSQFLNIIEADADKLVK